MTARDGGGLSHFDVPPRGAELAPLPPGQTIAGTRYRVLGRLGAGAMGEVYLAEHIDLEKKVALKTLLAESARKPEAMERFREEARAASMIGNPFICDVTDFGALPDGRVFYVMEYLDGRSVRELLKEGPLPVPRALGILRQIAKALGAAHDKGVIHLDVKPDNMVIVKRGRRNDAVKVVDFGLAGLLGRKLQRGGEREHTVHGTPEYVSPERIRGGAYDHRSDIYSLGAMAYEMLTGHCPFEDDDLIVVLRKHVVEAPMSLQKRAPARGIPADLDSVVQQMLAKDPEGRPQSMAVVEALLCEAQIAAKLQTEWDDLELPSVDAEWQKRIADRMPSPRSKRLKRVALASSFVALVGAGLAIYFGTRPAEVEQVYIDKQVSEEATTVIPWLKRATAAAQADRYVRPLDGSALLFIRKAEEEAEAARRESPGAKHLRHTYAGALAFIGSELARNGLLHLARAKYQEALLFTPDNAELLKKAELTASEMRRNVERSRTIAVTSPPSEGERAAEAAIELFSAAKNGKYSQARQSLPALARAGGKETAGMADALRRLASEAWTGSKRDDARNLYQLVAALDPADTIAAERATASDAPKAMPEPPPPAPAVTAAISSPTRTKRVAAPAEPEAEHPRNAPASKTAAREGERALEQGRLAQAEEAFNRAVRADAGNPEAIGGLAEVAFERARYTDALDLARRAARIAPKTTKYHVILGDAYFKLLRYDEALAAYKKAAALAPNNIAIKRRLARVSGKGG